MNNINFILSGFVALDAWRGSLPSKLVHALGVSLLLTAFAIGVASCATVARRSGRRATRSVAWLVRVLRRVAIGVHLVLGSLQVHCCLTRLLGFQRSLLGDTTCHWIELGTANQVLEVSTWREKNVHRLDVLGRELLDALRPFAADGDSESTQLAQLDLVAVEQLFH